MPFMCASATGEGGRLLAAPQRPTAGAPFVLVADVAWVLGAVVLLAGFPGLLTPAGRVGVGTVSGVVAAIAAGQAVGMRRRGHAPMSGHQIGLPASVRSNHDRTTSSSSSAT